jgi:hypothetical protein
MWPFKNSRIRELEDINHQLNVELEDYDKMFAEMRMEAISYKKTVIELTKELELTKSLNKGLANNLKETRKESMRASDGKFKKATT